jgi:hypothetical protein
VVVGVVVGKKESGGVAVWWAGLVKRKEVERLRIFARSKGGRAFKDELAANGDEVGEVLGDALPRMHASTPDSRF